VSPRDRTRLVAAALLLTVIVAFVIAVRADPRTPPKPTPEPLPESMPWPAGDAELAAARARARRLERTVRAQRRELRRQRDNFRRAFRSDPYGRHWLELAFLCVHQGEGRWTDPHAPYWGGLQMDWDFMRTYGREYLRVFGPANNWPRSVQIAVAIRAYLSGRGFYPWPNTARACGLL
jgi:hypothetical protein